MITAKTSRANQLPSKEYELLILLSRLHLSEIQRETARELIPQIKNWELFAKRCVGTYLASLAHVNLGLIGAAIPKEVDAVLTNSYNQILVRNIRLYQSFTTVLSELNAANIDCIPLKGIYLAETVYKDLGLRHLSDIDLLVRSADADKVCELMDAHGWTVREAEPRSTFEKEHFAPAHPFTFLKNGVTIELHTHLYNRNQQARITEEELWKNTFSETFCKGTIRQFHSEMLLQHLCLHLHKHLVGSECKMVSFCDIHELMAQRNQELDWNKFRDICEKFGCLDEVVQVFLLCRDHWHSEIPNAFFNNAERDKNIERKFFQFFTGQASEHSQEVENIALRSLSKLKSIDGFFAKTKFVLGYVFPRSVFMYRHFQLKQGTWLLPWYLIRIFNLITRFFVASFNRLKNALS